MSVLLAVAAASAAARAESLSDAWSLALKHNHGLAAVRLQVEAARQDRLVAAAERWPTAGLRTGYLLRTSEPSFLSAQPELGIPTLRLPYAQEDAAMFSARATAPLWTGGRVNRRVRAAGSRVAAAREASRWSEMQLMMAVTELYVAVLNAQQLTAVAEHALHFAQQKASNTVDAAREAQSSDREVLRAQVAVFEAQQGTLVARSRLSQALAAYNQALGRPGGFPVALQAPAVQPLHQPLQELTQHALEHRPDLLEASQRVRAFEHQAQACRAAKRPQVNAEFSYDFEQNRYQTPEGLGSAGVYLDWRLLDSSTGLRCKAALARAASAKAELDESRSLAAVDVLQAWNERANAQHDERLSAHALMHAREHARWVNERAAQGQAVEAERQESEAALARANARLVNAQSAKTLTEIRLRFVAGLLDSRSNPPGGY